MTRNIVTANRLTVYHSSGTARTGSPSLRRRFLRWHHSQQPLNDRRIDRLLGLRATDVDRRLVLGELLRREGSEQFDYCGTPYDIIRQVIAWAALTPDDVFYDLGAGFGRVLLYGALTSDAQFRGIEVVRERVLEINRV